MSELYWILVIGSLNTVCNILFFICLIGLFVFTIGYLIDDDKEKYMEECKGFFKSIIGILIVCGLLGIFTPSSKELYVIYGIGPTIDYIKENETAKQLPDKAIKALDIYLETLSNENSSK